jgi:GTPase
MPKSSPLPSRASSSTHSTPSREPAPALFGEVPIAAAVILGWHPASLGELGRLLDGLGVPVVRTLVHKRGSWFGSGKQRELGELLAAVQSEPGQPALTVVVDEGLRPGQLRQLEDALGMPVVDRTDVILRIFARRAQTRMAKLEVELARLRYETPRVREAAGVNDRGGGGGRGERGHTGVELRKQRMRARQVAITRELERLRAHSDAERERRSDAPTVALVGYTNAGKSSLMRALTGSEVLTRDQLFATLGTTVRALADVPPPRILVTDTVGFIRDLPTELVNSFRSTLEEARAADLLLFVVDAADSESAEELRVTRETIAAVGAGGVPSLLLLNKADLLSAEKRTTLAAAYPGAHIVSAHRDDDVAEVRRAIAAFFDARMIDDVLEVPTEKLALMGEIHGRVRVIAQDYDENGARVRVRGLPATLGQLRRQFPSGPPPETPADLVTLARRHGLAVSSSATAFETTGLDFLVVHAEDEAGDRFILRTPRRPEVFESSRVEARALRLVAPHLPVAVPNWCVHARALIAYRRLSGTPVVTVDESGPHWNLDPKALPETFLASFAQTLAALQGIDAGAAKNASLPTKTIDEVRSELSRTMDEVRATLAPSEKVWTRWQRFLSADELWPTHTALVHGDLHPGHLLIDETGRLTGILDWTEAALTDPGTDLAMFQGCFGPEALAQLLPHFERSGGKTWPNLPTYAAERWATFPASATAWALRTNNESIITYARTLLAGLEVD